MGLFKKMSKEELQKQEDAEIDAIKKQLIKIRVLIDNATEQKDKYTDLVIDARRKGYKEEEARAKQALLGCMNHITRMEKLEFNIKMQLNDRDFNGIYNSFEDSIISYAKTRKMKNSGIAEKKRKNDLMKAYYYNKEETKKNQNNLDLIETMERKTSNYLESDLNLSEEQNESLEAVISSREKHRM